MEKPKPKYKFSILSVVIIFAAIYLIELGIGAAVFFNLGLPLINKYWESKQQFSQNILSEQTTVYSFIKENKFAEASASAQLMLSHAKTSGERALSLQVIGEVQSAQAGSYLQGKKNFTDAINLYPNLPGAYIGLAGANLIEKDYGKAIINAQDAIKLSPKRTDFNYTLGLAYFGSGDKNNAIQNIQKAVDGNPNVTEYKNTLAAIKNGTFQLSAPAQTVPDQSGNQVQVVAHPTNSPQQAPSGPGYTRADVDELVKNLNQEDKDVQTLNGSYKGNNTYNQKIVDFYLSYASQRKVIAQRLLDKMSKGQSLDQSDFDAWSQYKVMGMGENYLVTQLQNGNGGY